MKNPKITTFITENPSKHGKLCICVRGVDTYFPEDSYTTKEVQEIINHLEEAVSKASKNSDSDPDQMYLFDMK